jgi:hypothetical protein
MGWEFKDGEPVKYWPEYQIVERDGGFEPQMQYQVNKVERWYALLPTGYMADPNVWKLGSGGESYVRVILPDRSMAERAILRARTINDQNQIASVPRAADTR